MSLSKVTPPTLFTGDLGAAKAFLQARLGQSDDFQLREIRLGGPQGRTALVGYLEGMIDDQALDNQVLQPLMLMSTNICGTAAQTSRLIQECLTTRGKVSRHQQYEEAISGVLDGNLAVFVDQSLDFMVIGAAGFPHRSIDKPETEHAVRGSREAFTDVLGMNIALIRRRLKEDTLRVKLLRIGTRSQTRIALLYVDGLTNPEVVRVVKARIEAICIDEVQESQVLETFLSDHPFTPFPLIRSTERPDEAVRTLVSGKLLVLTDNTPFALGVPTVLMDFYQTSEDYAFGFWAATMVRGIRFIGWVLALYLPSLYIALIAVNPEMVPNELALTIAGAREGLPFPPIIEVLIIEILIELIREAALRLPQPLGTTIGVVGGVVIGQAIVTAGLVSPLMIIFAAVSMLASFTSPTLDIGASWRILKWLLIILANVLGLLGVIIGTALIFGHLCSLSSFGVPYLSPVSPLRARDLADTIYRGPLFSLLRRPSYLRPLASTRLSPYVQPTEHPDLYGGQNRGKEDQE